jgi:cation diffusion facilitator CzcD-associated flavoprotein CzcO
MGALNVAIVGAGIGGLTAAIALRTRGVAGREGARTREFGGGHHRSERRAGLRQSWS